MGPEDWVRLLGSGGGGPPDGIGFTVALGIVIGDAELCTPGGGVAKVVSIGVAPGAELVPELGLWDV